MSNYPSVSHLCWVYDLACRLSLGAAREPVDPSAWRTLDLPESVPAEERILPNLVVVYCRAAGQGPGKLSRDTMQSLVGPSFLHQPRSGLFCRPHTQNTILG